MILDFGNTPAQHAQCHTTPAARFLEISDVSGLFAVFFLQSGSVVLDCGQTPPQHAQCHNTLAAQVQVFSFFCLGSCLVAQESHIHSIPMLHCSTKEADYPPVTSNLPLRCRPYHVECTGSLLTSEVKRHRARLVLGWGTAWEDLRVLSALSLHALF